MSTIFFVYDSFLHAVMKCNASLIKQLMQKGRVKRQSDGLVLFINVFLMWYNEI